MTELLLKFTDEQGDAKRVSVNDEIFIIGRTSENDLCIPDSRLSREHVRVERFSESFYVSDSRSSNGTTLNGARLSSSTQLKNGDRLNLGGAVEINVELSDGNSSYQSPATENYYPSNDDGAYSSNVQTSTQATAVSSGVSASSSSIPTAIFWLAPVFGLIVLIVVGGLFFAFSGGKKEVAQNDDFYTSTPRTRPSKTDDSTSDTPKPKKTESIDTSNSQTSSTPDSTGNLPTAPPTSSDSDKIEQNAAAFLRRIAQSDPKAFLTGKQAEIVSSKISQFKSSSALAENLKAIKKSESQFISLAASKNLKPQFLATAALAKIGNNRGDPLAVANTMLPALSELKITLDNKLADDNLMIIASYERGASGNPRSLQSTLEAIAKNAPNISPREIRTIWFLHDKGKITDAEFNFALQFIAIGAITQNPKDFNVSADAVVFN